jgi:hypothetical protein
LQEAREAVRQNAVPPVVNPLKGASYFNNRKERIERERVDVQLKSTEKANHAESRKLHADVVQQNSESETEDESSVTAGANEDNVSVTVTARSGETKAQKKKGCNDDTDCR